MESNQDAQACSANVVADAAPSSTLTPPDSSLGGKRPADQSDDQATTKRPRMSTWTEGEDDTDSLSDAQLQTALDRLEEESKLRKVAQRAAIVARVKPLRAESEIVAAPSEDTEQALCTVFENSASPIAPRLLHRRRVHACAALRRFRRGGARRRRRRQARAPERG
jgi:hypothetical protein